jgi:hypothetical protein
MLQLSNYHYEIQFLSHGKDHFAIKRKESSYPSTHLQNLNRPMPICLLADPNKPIPLMTLWAKVDVQCYSSLD